MAESQAEQILEAVVSRLVAMTGERHWGGAYPNDPVVTREYRAPDLVPQTPHLAVLSASGASARILSINPPMNIEHLFPVTIYGTIEQTAEIVVDTWLQRFVKDIRDTLLAGASLGGLSSGIGELITVESDEGEFSPRAQLAMTVTYKFRETKEIA